MGHKYHPHCGCSQCDRTEEADEARDEYTQEFAPAAAAKLMVEDDFAWGALADQSPDVLLYIAKAAGEFFTRYRAAQTPQAEAQAGYPLYRELLPYIEAAAKEQAETETAALYDQADAA